MTGVSSSRLIIAPRKVTASKPVWYRQTSRLCHYSDSPVSSNSDLMAESIENSFMAEMREMMMNLSRQVSTLTEKLTRLESQATSKDPMVQNPSTGVHIRAGKEKELSEKLDKLALELLNLKNHNPKKIDMSEFSIFPGVTLPSKFKVPDFVKYDGSGSPRSHLKMFINSLEQYGLNSQQMVKLFKMSLSGVATKWFLTLDSAYTKTWEEIVEKFIEQLSYDDGVEVTCRDLEMLKQHINEPFSTFLKKWRRKAAQMTNRPSEEDQLR
ncbi:uncharacterized protein LOC143855862 [Tasmannia lanceolata]|uniref:uncharacterized protein LOC143855862 n=1 Tax=Tasmannia lanceolata TaxID=3420 RepID=UPI004064C41E